MTTHKTWVPKGVTIIELMVVIGITMLLAALIGIALGQVRERSKQAKCAMQLRQITLALGVYAGDYDGYGPTTPLDGVISSDEIADGGPDLPVILGKFGIKGEEVFWCPSDKIAFFQNGFGSSYIYGGTTGVRLFESGAMGSVDITKLLLIGEGMALHRGGNNIAFMDGHVGFSRP